MILEWLQNVSSQFPSLFYFFLLFIGGCCFFLGWRIDCWKVEKLRNAASEMGFYFYHRLEDGDDMDLGSNVPFDNFRNIMQGYRGGFLWVIFSARFFDTPDHMAWKDQTLAVATLGNIALPSFFIGTNSEFTNHLKSYFCHKRQTVHVNAPIFSRDYILRGENEELILKLFSNRLLDFLQGKKRRLCLYATGDKVLFITPSEITASEKLGKLIDEWSVFLLELKAAAEFSGGTFLKSSISH